MSYTQDLIALIRRREISRGDLDTAAAFVLDALASAYAGSATAVGGKLRDWAAGSELDAMRRALLAGALTHITETDDLHRASVTHPGCVVVPVALALGEKTAASGEAVLAAVLHGFEAMCRIGAAVGPAHYRVWHNTATCGPFGSAMAAAALLELDDERAVHALGNAGTQSSGLWQFLEEGSMSKHLHAGRAAESGWLAAELAAYGITGPARILEGPKGFFAATCADPLPERILADPAADWQLLQTSIKPWPSCRHTHPLVDCALDIYRRLDGQIDEVWIETYQAALDVCDNPLPKSEYQAKFSLQHTAAIALLDGAVGLDSFDADARRRAADLRSRVHVAAAEPYLSAYPVSWGARVAVSTASGESIDASRKDCRGDPELALDRDGMRTKAMGLLRYGGLDETNAATLCDSVLALSAAKTCPPLVGELLRRVGLG